MTKTAAVYPIIGEFGYVVFDIQPKVRAWLREQKAERKVVFASRALAPLFEEATEIIEPPEELLPTAPATMRSIVYERWKEGDPERVKIERLVDWARSQVEADTWLEIPYFHHGPWLAPSSYVPLRSRLEAPSEPYVVIAARARQFDSWRNWSAANWEELVGRIKAEWNVQVRSIGKPPDTYYPPGALPQEVDELQRLEHSIALLNHAVCSISSNSGPTHLSLMAGCPTFAWGEPYLKPFMERSTNPLGTPCSFYAGGWDPDVEAVWKALCRWKETLESQGLWQQPAAPSPRLSMCMIARDSSRTIEAALKSVKPWVDELVVVDTGSVDQTPAIAEACGARVFHAPWQDSFSTARNESIRQALGEWVFWMDSDDTIDEANGKKLRQCVQEDPRPSTLGYVVQVKCPGESRTAAGAYDTATVVDHIKIFRRLPAIRFTGRIHEQVLPAIRRLGGVVEWTDVTVVHSGSDRSVEGRVRKHTRDLRLLELEMSEDPDNTFTLFNLGMTLLDMARPEDALNALCRSLQTAERGESHIRKVYSLLAQTYTELKRPETALITCLKGLGVCPGDSELLFRKGVLEQSRGDLNRAENSFRAIVDAVADRHFSSIDHGILGVKTWHNLAVLYEQKGSYQQAAEGWNHVLEHDPGNHTAWRGYLDALTATGNTAGIEELMERGRAGGMSEDLLCLGEMRLLVQQGNARQAVENLRETYGRTNSLELLEELCRMSFTSNLLDVAEWGLLELTGRRPQDASAFQNLSMVHLRRYNYSKAATSAKKSLSLRPTSTVAKNVLDAAMQGAALAESIS